MPNIGKLIKRLRQASNLTQKQLGSLVGVDQGVISRWEKGKVKPSIRYLDKLKYALSVPLDSSQLIDFFITSVELDVNLSLLLDSKFNVIAASEPLLSLSQLSKQQMLEINYLSLIQTNWQPIYTWLESKKVFSKRTQWIKTLQPSPKFFSNSYWLQSLCVPLVIENNKLVFRVSLSQLDEEPRDKLAHLQLQAGAKYYELALLE